MSSSRLAASVPLTGSSQMCYPLAVQMVPTMSVGTSLHTSSNPERACECAAARSGITRVDYVVSSTCKESAHSGQILGTQLRVSDPVLVIGDTLRRPYGHF
jgi:hypothetical protein